MRGGTSGGKIALKSPSRYEAKRKCPNKKGAVTKQTMALRLTNIKNHTKSGKRMAEEKTGILGLSKKGSTRLTKERMTFSCATIESPSKGEGPTPNSLFTCGAPQPFPRKRSTSGVGRGQENQLLGPVRKGKQTGKGGRGKKSKKTVYQGLRLQTEKEPQDTAIRSVFRVAKNGGVKREQDVGHRFPTRLQTRTGNLISQIAGGKGSLLRPLCTKVH